MNIQTNTLPNYGSTGLNTQYHSPSLLSPVPNTYSQQHSPMFSTSHNSNQYLDSSPNKALNNDPCSRTSIDLSGNPEQWRSLVVDGLTYNTMLSVGGTNSPKVAGSTGDLLTQQLHSLSPSRPNTAGGPFSYHTRDHDAGSRTSIDQGESDLHGVGTPQFKYTKSGFAKQGSLHTLGLNGLHSPDFGASYSSPNTMRALELDSRSNLEKLNDKETDDIFKRAMERSKETYEILSRSHTNLKSSITEGIAKTSLLDQVGRIDYSQTYKHY